jgi:hypothetical protein|tara:strand:+ start:3892 stop:4272 length:381 start_codon:yes stop_codon:yes gene_type:complete
LEIPAIGISWVWQCILSGKEAEMITVLVRFKLPDGVGSEQYKKTAEEAAPRFQGMQGLKTKYFLYNEEGYGGGFYVWESREQAEALYTEGWADAMQERMASRPEVTYFETSVVVDNESGAIRVEAA